MINFIEEVNKSVNFLRNIFLETPLQKNEFLSRKYNASIYLKREDLTPIRSYKIRGAFNFVINMINNVSLNTVFVCASAGNHSQGVAFVCRYFKRKAIIFMPITTPQQKIEKTKTFGGNFVEIRLTGDTFDQCYSTAQDFVHRIKGIMIPPFDDKRIIIGQASVMKEIFSSWKYDKEPDIIIIPVGGGGLASGISKFIDHISWKTQIYFAEPKGAPSLFYSLKKKFRIKLKNIDNFVDGASVSQIGKINFEILRKFTIDNIILIPEDRLCTTIKEMLNIEGIVLEPAGALSIDALKNFDINNINNKKIIVIVSGGNFDFERLPEVKERSLIFEGLKKYYIVNFPQRPGALKNFIDLFSVDDDIARFEYLKKTDRDFASVLISIETKKPENFIKLHKRFTDENWIYKDITEDQFFKFII